MHFDKTTSTKRELITPGKYECVLNAEWKETSAKKPYIGLTLRIRKDVEQAFGGRLVFDGIYESKLNPGEYNVKKINAILAAIPESKQDFEDYDELVLYINKQLFLVDIGIQQPDPNYPNSKEKNVVMFNNYETTKHPEYDEDKDNGSNEKASVVIGGGAVTKNTEKLEALDDDLPF